MFQRLRGAIDRTISEEQARQKSVNETGTIVRSSSTSRQAGKKAKNKPDLDADLALNPDPAVFEAAFVIDDSAEPSRAGTPAPMTGDKEKGDGDPAAKTEVTEEQVEKGIQAKENGLDENKTEKSTTDTPLKESQVAAAPVTSELTPELRQRLRKLEKLEATYPELLRSYRVAHRRATAIEPFEKALRENTPLTSIGDPSALVEYLSQLNLKGDMVMGELKKVSAEKDELKKKHRETEDRLKVVEEELSAAKDGKAVENTTTEEASAPVQPNEDKGSEKVKSPVASVIGMFSPKQKASTKPEVNKEEADGDLFSYDDEMPQLQADIASKADEIMTLRTEVDSLKEELTAAREGSVGLLADLEKATKDLGESRGVSSEHDDLKSQLDERNAEVARLTGQLEKNETQLKELETKLEAETSAHSVKVKEFETSLIKSQNRTNELNAELTKASNAKNLSKKLIDDLNTQIEGLKKEKTESQGKIDELSKKAQNQPASKSEAPSTTAQQAPTATGGATAASKKKNKKKGKGGKGASGEPAPFVEAPTSQVAEGTTEATSNSANSVALESEIAKLKEEVSEKDEQIDRLIKKRKVEEDLQEELDSLRDDLVNIGQDHVVAKEKIKALEAEKVELKLEIAELEKKISSSASDAKVSGKLQGEMDKLQKDYGDLKDKTSSLQSDLGAAQQLAQQRFKDLSELKEVLQKAQPELKSLRQESAQLKTTKEELAAKTKELNELEKKEKNLQRDLSRAQQVSTDREKEVKTIQEKLTNETNAKVRLEDAQRVSGRDSRRVESEKIELSAKAEKTERELQKVQEEVNKLRPRVKELEEQMHKLRREKTAAQEEVDFKTQQYSNAQGLLTSMRDQSSEMSVQLKESKSQAEALDEELAEVQRLLQERTREGETMRRLLADVDERADTKVRDMRGRMEAAIEERDRIEDESSTMARRKTREMEDLKGKLRDLEREVKTLGHERDELEQREKEWRRRREELESVEEKAEAEANEVRATVSQLRTALDASEGQVRETEKQRAELRKLLEEARQRYDRLQKDLKTAQSKLAVSSSRSSMDSSRGSLTPNGSSAGGAAGETMYLKTILLQFLEQKDGRLRAQLVPVLGKLLKFDKNDEQKWQKAVQHIEVK